METPKKVFSEPSEAFLQSKRASLTASGGHGHDSLDWHPNKPKPDRSVSKYVDTPKGKHKRRISVAGITPLKNGEISLLQQTRNIFMVRLKTLYRQPMELITYFMPVVFLLCANVSIYGVFPEVYIIPSYPLFLICLCTTLSLSHSLTLSISFSPSFPPLPSPH